jgi:hypothetical protein
MISAIWIPKSYICSQLEYRVPMNSNILTTQSLYQLALSVLSDQTESINTKNSIAAAARCTHGGESENQRIHHTWGRYPGTTPRKRYERSGRVDGRARTWKVGRCGSRRPKGRGGCGSGVAVGQKPSKTDLEPCSHRSLPTMSSGLFTPVCKNRFKKPLLFQKVKRTVTIHRQTVARGIICTTGF